MRGNNGVKFFAVILIIGILTYIAYFGDLAGIRIPGAKDINLGIDVKGGVHAMLEGKQDNGALPTQNQLDTAKRIITIRLDNQGITDKNITSDLNTGRILVEIPWKTNEKDFNPQKTINEAIKTALLTFQEVDESKKNADGSYKPTGKIILQGTDVVGAMPQPDSTNGGYEVSLTLSPNGVKKFAEATARLVGKPIAIFMDNIEVSHPIVNTAIPDGNAVIQMGGNNSSSAMEEAKKLAETIRAGALPFKMQAVEVNAISPTLGTYALNVLVSAGFLAIILVWMFMLLYYRLPGILADIALLAHTVIQLLVLSWLNVTNLTLPGIAGIILTIGMGVDANIIIFERIKEELQTI